ncbi:Uncharacterised protein [Vibrio cholerae]|uniref:Uncharacterized protein n=2 Tax=Vibrio cholerae TaxID=666 RepID=A0A656AJ65_VIBCL|nr:Uncharacterised protein [Vibrio cholerae]CSC45802.1 Uncharacterised protein [Vibrio cholerae]CSD11285.1 Uncharacterised protein [Vibrio cholerae]
MDRLSNQRVFFCMSFSRNIAACRVGNRLLLLAKKFAKEFSKLWERRWNAGFYYAYYGAYPNQKFLKD